MTSSAPGTATVVTRPLPSSAMSLVKLRTARLEPDSVDGEVVDQLVRGRHRDVRHVGEAGVEDAWPAVEVDEHEESVLAGEAQVVVLDVHRHDEPPRRMPVDITRCRL